MNYNPGGFMSKNLAQLKHVPAPIRHHLLKQQSSEQTIKAYCHKNDINPQTFYGWRKRYSKQVAALVKSEISAPQISFASLGTMSTPQQHTMFDIRFPGGTEISVYAGTTVQNLAPFLSLISGSKVQC
jgi:hypothetical protein